jgi:hypothetical protein
VDSPLEIGLDGAWVPWLSQDVRFDDAGRQETIQHVWRDGGWQAASKTIDTFDADANLTEHLTHGWREGAWRVTARTTNAFDDNGDRIESLHAEWREAGWVNTNRETITYSGARSRR